MGDTGQPVWGGGGVKTADQDPQSHNTHSLHRPSTGLRPASLGLLQDGDACCVDRQTDGQGSVMRGQTVGEQEAGAAEGWVREVRSRLELSSDSDSTDAGLST